MTPYKTKFNIGDKVVVAEDTHQKYRPDVKVVTIDEIYCTPKMTKFKLSDGTSVTSEAKMYLLGWVDY